MLETVDTQTGALVAVPDGMALDALEQQTRGEVDIQIATARRYPRSIKTFIDQTLSLVTLDQDTAERCIYALPRDGKTIEGPSARFAEIAAACWCHMRIESRVASQDDHFITSRGMAWDLQTNVAIAFEARRRITNRAGKVYNDDMIAVTANAASSIAIRNAVLKVIPAAFWRPLYEKARAAAVGKAETLANRRAKMLEHFQKLGVTAEKVFGLLEVKGPEEITLEHMPRLIGLASAIRDGDTTVDEAFGGGAPAIREVQRKADASTSSTSQATAETKTAQADAKPAATETKPADPAASVTTYVPTHAYHLKEVIQPNPAKPYQVFRTTEGVTFHSWDKTVIEHAKAACASQLPVRFTATEVDFKSAPWRVIAIEVSQGEREPGGDDE